MNSHHCLKYIYDESVDPENPLSFFFPLHIMIIVMLWWVSGPDLNILFFFRWVYVCVCQLITSVLLRSGPGVELSAISDYAESLLQSETSSSQRPGSSRQPCGAVLSLSAGTGSPVPVWLEGGLPHTGRDTAQLLCLRCPHAALDRHEGPGARWERSSSCNRGEAKEETVGFQRVQGQRLCHLHHRRIHYGVGLVCAPSFRGQLC